MFTMENITEIKAKRSILFKDLRSPKYRQRVVNSKKQYNRNVEKQNFKKQIDGT
jgi:hypothetical protein